MLKKFSASFLGTLVVEAVFHFAVRAAETHPALASVLISW